MTGIFSCPMCGYTFDKTAHTGCQSCPLNGGCSLICCPQCGYQMVDPGQSSLARLASGLLSKMESLTRNPKNAEEGR
jgi:ribosomal protein L37AE/L43A